ncbi:MAG TPA: 5-(carboxyamino)imidazole ribonucleotide synthase [Candidatus Acidoferrum sp.]|nr:5-(carboxyamino)imidazole ribonucleotide synthase [Candidatus Acidoferrum sp.]
MSIGILGGGQLGYMLALAGYPLGLRFRFLDPSPEAPVGRIAPRVTGDFSDRAALEKFAHGLEVVTYEFENVPVDAVHFLAKKVSVFPPPGALETAQDRLREKQLFEKLGIPTTEFASVPAPSDLEAALKKVGLPAVLKTRRMGYDGKGQWILKTQEDVRIAKEGLPRLPFIAERFVPFTREISVLAARGKGGETAFYPLVENHHRKGILRLSLAPAPSVSPQIQRAAEEAARMVLESLNYVGVLAIEFFEHDGELLANEMAPRVHNSGHWTIEGAVTSQFENHLRAINGFPLGSTTAIGSSAMINLIGEVPQPAKVLAIPSAHLHLYGKEPREGRKLGHVTLRAPSFDQLTSRFASLPAFFQRPDFCLNTRNENEDS